MITQGYPFHGSLVHFQGHFFLTKFVWLLWTRLQLYFYLHFRGPILSYVLQINDNRPNGYFALKVKHNVQFYFIFLCTIFLSIFCTVLTICYWLLYESFYSVMFGNSIDDQHFFLIKTSPFIMNITKRFFGPEC